MGGWDANGSSDVLERIVALLFALAGLADLAAGLPCHRRRHVLGILSCGEAEARAFLIGIPAGTPDPSTAPGATDDASCLAARLRMLALLLCAMLARRLMLPGAAEPRACRPSYRMSGPAVRWLDASAPPASDTS